MESIEPGSSQSKPSAARAVEYVRMSTEHQQYSTENQREIIRQSGPELSSEPFVEQPHILGYRQIPVAEAPFAESQVTT
jgi:hypothetical protein